MSLQVDGFLMGVDQGDPEGAKIMMDLQMDIDSGEVKYARQEKATFCGRAYQQDKGGSTNVTMEAYVKSIQAAQHRGLRIVAGPLQWAARVICFEEALEAFRSASALGAPTVKNLQDGSAAIRRILKRDDLLIKFSVDRRCFRQPAGSKIATRTRHLAG
eukprot:6414739-Pyramimonas_sp.AAC.1